MQLAGKQNHKQVWRVSLDNPVNISGKKLEDTVEQYLVENHIAYQRAKAGAFEIDFIIDTDFGKVYADCTNQNVVGSVEEKLPHKIWKYYKKYKYDNVYIIKGDQKISNHVLEHCNDLARVYNFDLQFVSCDQFCEGLSQREETFFG